jgi:hypothetical protein
VRSSRTGNSRERPARSQTAVWSAQPSRCRPRRTAAEFRHLRRRRDTELFSQHHIEPPVHPDSFGDIPLGNQNTHHRAVCALAQRLRPHRCVGSLNGLTMSAGLREARGHRLERVSPQLTQSLPFQQDRVAIPARQGILGLQRFTRCPASPPSSPRGCRSSRGAASCQPPAQGR